MSLPPPHGRLRLPRAPFDLWLLAAVALWLLGVGYGLRDPWPADEPRFALIARDMVDTGRWWIPHRGPELYAEKPPVFLWLQAATYWLTGSVRHAFLLPSLLAALGTLGLVVDLLRRMHGRRVALLGGFALLFTLQFTLQGRTAQIDMLLVLFTTLGLYGLLRHLLWGPAWGWYVLGGLACGLGVLTKGTGFLPWLILLPWALARRRGMRGLARFAGGWRWWLGPLALLFPLLLWALPLLWVAAQPGNAEVAAYRDDLLLRQTLTRYSNAWHHREPFWYFLVEVVPLFWMPLSLLLPWAIPAWRRRIRRGDARPLLLTGWVVLVLLFFSLSSGKRGVYILPALPALALALAPLLPGLLARRGVRRALLGAALALAGLLTLGALWALVGEPRFAQRLAQDNGVAPWPWLLACGSAGLLLCAWLRRRGELALPGVLLVLWSGYGLVGYPQMDAARSGAALMQRVAGQLDGDAQLGVLGAPEQLLLQARHPARSFGYRAPPEAQRAAALAWLAESPRHWLLRQPGADPCLDEGLAIPLGRAHRRDWQLLPRAALRPGCAAAQPPVFPAPPR
jgi:4-amino-4-deoxy-L-arabinose transferase-like glycosyltransferase